MAHHPVLSTVFSHWRWYQWILQIFQGIMVVSHEKVAGNVE